MKSLLLLPLLACVLSAKALFECRYGVQPRREWRKLEDADKKKYINGLLGIMKRPNEDTPSFFDKLVKQHTDYVKDAHGNAPFFPWHRYLLGTLEQELQKNDNVMLPYWNWGYDSQAPEKAPFWGPDPLQFGSNGDADTGCITDGAFAGYTILYPEKRCLRRRWRLKDRISAFIDETQLQSLIVTSQNYNTYREAIEDPHGIVHVSIGGDMSSTRTSPNDPVFYLHHTNVDRLWWKWQVANPQLAKTYDGPIATAQAGSVKAADTNLLTPYSAKVSDVFNTEDLCYKYIEEDLTTTKPPLPPPTIPPAPAPEPTKPEPPKPEPPKPEPPKPEPPKPEPPKPEPEPEPRSGRNRREDKPTGKGHNKIGGLPLGGILKGAAAPGQLIKNLVSGITEPLSKYVKTKPAPEGQTPSSTDRNDLTKIRVPDPLPLEWIKENFLNVDRVRSNEQKIADKIRKNNAKGEIVDGALWTRPGVLAKLVADGEKKFYADVEGLRVEVEAPEEKKALQAVSNIQELIKQTLKAKGKGKGVKLFKRSRIVRKK